ncbi:thioesterase family protein [Paenibacillus sediminis]|uniref:Acyl-CoA thioester hydrolase n=1 Tax=Paenibacillus sediminis TaxID=664909 RepID=A0ABS4H0L1_9BACL|nr:thioesterase family protein [Paenibacillus sediminis]MBP1936068.1 acyl-CoA thioester hydrolase [Paenibacillus sediminis]
MFICEVEVPVRYAETDAMGIVHHANYLVWFELARTKYLDDIGISYPSIESRGFLIPVLEVNLTYKKPFRYGETALVKTWIEQYEGLKVIYNYEIYNGQGELCIEGSTSHVVVKKENFKPINIRKHLPDLHTACEENKR